MGNKIDTIKIKQNIGEISETSDVNESFLKTEFKTLYELINSNIKNNNDLQKVFIDIFSELNEDSIINFSKNLINYLQIQLIENVTTINLSLDLLLLILEVIYTKHKNLREIFSYTITKISEKYNKNDFKEDETNNTINTAIREAFPFNVLIFAVDLVTNDEFFIKETNFKSDIEKLEISRKLIKIIYYIAYFQKNNDISTKTFIEFFDPFKILLSCTNIFSKLTVNKLIVKLFLIVFANFTNYVNYEIDPNITRQDFEEYIKLSFHLLIWFCYDINKFFFREVNTNESVEFYFENEFNRKFFSFLTAYILNIKEDNTIIKIVDNYNKFYSECLIAVILYNNHLFKSFVNNFFSNYEKFNVSFKTNVKFFLIYLFEINPVK
jgi:hypothetical protein